MQQIQPLFINPLELYTLSYFDIPDPDKINLIIPQSPLFIGSGKTIEGITKKRTKKLNGIKNYKNKKIVKKKYINDYGKPIYGELRYEEPKLNESNNDDNEENEKLQYEEPSSMNLIMTKKNVENLNI